MSRSLLPPNATPLERDLEAAMARAADLSLPIAQLWDPQRCPAEALPWLGWAVGVEEWSTDWPEQIQRDVIAATPDIRRHRGTVWAVREALKSAGYADAEIEEGLPSLRHDGAAYHGGDDDYSKGTRWAVFRILADIGEDIGITTAERDRLTRLVARAKPARSVMRDVRYQTSVADELTMEDTATVSPALSFADTRPAGLRHDGAIRHNQASPLPPAALHHDRAIRYNADARHTGQRPRSGWHVTGRRYDNVWDRLDLIIVAQNFADRIEADAHYNARGVHDGQLDHSGTRTAPVDALALTVTRDIKHNRRRRHNGAWRHQPTDTQQLAA